MQYNSVFVCKNTHQTLDLQVMGKYFTSTSYVSARKFINLKSIESLNNVWRWFCLFNYLKFKLNIPYSESAASQLLLLSSLNLFFIENKNTKKLNTRSSQEISIRIQETKSYIFPIYQA